MITTEAARYANRLVQHAHAIVGAIHDDGPNEMLTAIGKALAIQPPADTDPVIALIVLIGAMVDPDATTEDRLGWVRTHSRDARPCRPVVEPVSHYLPASATPYREMTRAERDHAITALEARGLSAEAIAAQLGITERTVVRQRARRRDNNRDQGVA